MESEAVAQELRVLEERLAMPSASESRASLATLLAVDFREFGSSGRASTMSPRRWRRSRPAGFGRGSCSRTSTRRRWPMARCSSPTCHAASQDRGGSHRRCAVRCGVGTKADGSWCSIRGTRLTSDSEA